METKEIFLSTNVLVPKFQQEAQIFGYDRIEALFQVAKTLDSLLSSRGEEHAWGQKPQVRIQNPSCKLAQSKMQPHTPKDCNQSLFALGSLYVVDKEAPRGPVSDANPVTIQVHNSQPPLPKLPKEILKMGTSVCMGVAYVLRLLPSLHNAHANQRHEKLKNGRCSSMTPTRGSSLSHFSLDWKMRLAVCALLGTLLSKEEYVEPILQEKTTGPKHLAADVRNSLDYNLLNLFLCIIKMYVDHPN